jgi:hypothetical protein
MCDEWEAGNPEADDDFRADPLGCAAEELRQRLAALGIARAAAEGGEG